MFHWFGKVSFVPYSKVQDFAVHLKDGRLMGTRCTDCGYQTFPPRADCPQCLSENFEFVEYSGKGTLFTYTVITAAPTGFDDVAPYTVAVVELEEGGRLMGWRGKTLTDDELEIGMPVQVVPEIYGETENIHLLLKVEKPGTTWHKAPAPHLG
jgi:uncharacterized OB-fold protein